MSAPQRCPRCGAGVIADIGFDGASEDLLQQSDSRQVTEYSCGHVIQGESLGTASQEELDVERRTSAETTDPISP